MEQEKALKEMAKELVKGMEAEEAKGKFLSVIDGNDLYDVILGNPQDPLPEVRTKKKRGRRKKAPGQQSQEISELEEKS